MSEAREQRRGPGRPALIGRELIVEAVSSAENLDTLTMRGLAARLGVTHGALYRWVKNRDELFDLISEVLVDRILAASDDRRGGRERLVEIAQAMRVEFLALPGYATHVARPHRHHAHSLGRLREAVVAAFTDDGVDADLAEQSWQIYITCTVSWLAAIESPLEIGSGSPRFEVFLDSLLRGLPARDLGEAE